MSSENGPQQSASAEVERRLGEEERHKVLPHREVARLAHVKRVVAGMRGGVGVEIGVDGLLRHNVSRILAAVVALVRMERAQLLPQGRVIRRPVGRGVLDRRLPRDRRHPHQRGRSPDESSP